MTAFFTTILYQPIFNLFVWLYDFIPDMGIIIFIVTVAIKLALHPLTTKSIKAQKDLQEMQPKLEALKKEFKGDQQRIAQETMKLYSEHKVNPLGSCLPMLIQLPVFFALYYVLRGLFGEIRFDLLYSFVSRPENISPISLGIFDLSQKSIVLAVLAAGTQFFQARMMQSRKPPKEVGEGGKDESMTSMMNKQMLYFLPIMTLMIGMSFPGGLTLYWFLSTLFMLLQQVWIFKKHGGTDSEAGVIEGKIVE
ncbi:MAG: hypothetical protein CO029_03520 [Candidatus Magasanikbacteria bacterium CG_4_9_14_0_2_um_filter_41_10]|uniref:Membrane insertase YidC/Oxa/ALB C-terminal domain-containing protein n=1 Tax=Candidatus Magasanikbacteria bacterium CG_4_10_14_0_2_um_filter_41_31 TaxID=1974639 RepID=A0A2M7V5K0_9BACT|nr:MAG: hypothetical protein COX83_00785 [Candidatus Magasanikbacteria bacterium CG_4_10_14_0_2_um_filter_41_31]PJC53302.1 MAG: hypothetical protein CO029_03520 [Candidatus Magasanikbacteria bacterium CG_4_9_14_0_2_um_filter_41_10]